MLTAKQMKFVEEIGEGGSQSNAYLKAYDTSQMAPMYLAWMMVSNTQISQLPKAA